MCRLRLGFWFRSASSEQNEGNDASHCNSFHAPENTRNHDRSGTINLPDAKPCRQCNELRSPRFSKLIC